MRFAGVVRVFAVTRFIESSRDMLMCESGNSMSEYAIVIGILGAAMMGALTTIGQESTNQLTTTQNNLYNSVVNP